LNRINAQLTMCTVTYLPLEHGNFVLTSNRDESPLRPMALVPEVYVVNGQQVMFPKDPSGGGTWMASSRKFTLCLLNGSDHFQEPRPPYRMSRGLVLLDFFSYGDVDKFTEDYDFTAIEPFTLICIEHDRRKMTKILWHGEELETKPLDSDKPNIWSSFTLYDRPTIRMREEWFAKLQVKPSLISDDMLEFHRFGGSGNPQTDLVMVRDGKVMTVSITQVVKTSAIEMRYTDLLNEQKSRVSLNEQ